MSVRDRIPPRSFSATISSGRFQELASLFSKRKMLVVGDVMLDEWIWGTVSRISPEAPVPVVQVEKRTYTPGGASNVAANLRSLGARTFLAGFIGADEPGKILKKELQKRKTDVQALFPVKGRPTIVKTRIIAHNQQVVRADVEARESVDGKDSKSLSDFLRAGIGKMDAVLFSDYNKGCLSSSLVSQVISDGMKKGKMIVAGAKPSNLSFFRGVTLLVLNQQEAAQALGKEIATESQLREAGEQLLNDVQARGVLITRGELGMTLFQGSGKVFSVPAQATQVYDVSGAGDTVMAAASLALACGASMEEAVVVANHAAGVVVRKFGTATISPEELQGLF